MKEIKDLFNENYISLKKNIEDFRRWKDAPCLWICRIIIVKTAMLPKAVYMFNAIPTKIPMAFIMGIENSTLKFTWKHKKTPNSQGNIEQKKQHWRYHNS
jgi:hypothetical protein